MAKDIDFQLELDTPKVAQPQSFDLGIDFDAQQTQNEIFPTRQRIQRATYNIRQQEAQTPRPTQQEVLQQDRNEGVTISQGEPQKPSLIRRAVRAIPGDSAFERSLERDVIDPIARVGRFLLPTEQDYYREATQELGEGATADQVIAKGRELMVDDGFIPPEEIGGPIVSPLDTTPAPVALSTRGRAGINRTIRLLSRRFAGDADEKAVESVVRQVIPNVSDENASALSRMVARTNDEKRIAELLQETVRQTERQVLESGARRFTPDNLPTPGRDETIVAFERTGGGQQYVFNNVDDALDYMRRFDGDTGKLEIGVVPKNVLKRVADDDVGSRRNVFTIPQNIADDVVRSNRTLQQNILDEAEVAQFIDQEILPKTAAPRSPEAVLGRTPAPTRTITGRENVLLRDKLQQAQQISRRASVATRKEVKDIQNDLVNLVSDLPLQERGKFIATIKNIQTPQQLQRSMPDIERRVTTALDKVAEQQQRKALRGQVRDVIRQKNLQNTESFRKALELPSLNQMTVDDLRSFARNLAQFKPGDRFLSQRILETIDRTNLSGMKTYREVQERLAKEAGVSVEDLRKVKVSWMDKFRYDTALSRQNPFYDVVVRKMNGSLVEGNIRFASFEDELDDLLVAARKSRSRGVGQRVVPTDERIFRYIESPNKNELADTLTNEEMAAANFLIDRYAEARDYLLSQNVLNKYVQDYVTHIRRSGLEAYKQDGLISSIKETFEQYKVDQANFQVLNEKTGDVLPLEKFFAFAQQRTGGLKPTQNVGRAAKAYFMSFERKRALDSVVPELQVYAQAVTPPMKTAKGLDWDPTIKTFLKKYINNKRGRPATVLFNPGSPPDVIMRGVQTATRLIDLGLSIPNFVAANVGEQASTFIQQGTRRYALGAKRMNTKKGKDIIEKYRGFVGRSPWLEIRDTSKNFPDKLMTMMLAGFHDASVRANKQALLGSLTPDEFRRGEISTERLAQIRNEAGRWRALDNSSSIIGSTAEGKIFTQYKAWAVPIISSTSNNLTQFVRTASRAENPFATREGQELMREAMVVGTVALVINSYLDDEDDSFVGQMVNKASRDALSAIGALDPEMWVSTPRAWQYFQDVQSALRSLVLLEEYKSGEEAGTLKGDDALLRLVTPAPVRQVRGAAESVASQEDSTDEMDFDLEFDDIEAETGPDFELDFDLGL